MKPEGVAGPEVGEPLLEGVGVEELRDPLDGRDREVVVALGADVEVLDDLLAEERRPAAVAAHPDAFGHPLGLEVAVPGVGRASAITGHGRGGSFGGVRHRRSGLSCRDAGAGGRSIVLSRRRRCGPTPGPTVDRLEPAGRDVVVELDPGVAAEVAGDELGDRLAGDQADRLVAVPPDQGLERGLDPVHRLLDRLAVGRADGAGVVDPLAEDLQVPPLDLVDLEPLPEPLVEVAQLVDPPGAEAQGPADGLGGPEGVLARARSRGRPARRRRAAGQLLGQLGDLGPAAVAQGDVEDALDPVLLVVDRRAGADQDDLGHSCDGGPAGRAGALPRSLPRRIPSANSARAAA